MDIFFYRNNSLRFLWPFGNCRFSPLSTADAALVLVAAVFVAVAVATVLVAAEIALVVEPIVLVVAAMSILSICAPPPLLLPLH